MKRDILVNLGLVAFGTITALALGELVLRPFIQPKAGAEFESLSDVRAAMTNPAASTPIVMSDGRKSERMGAVVDPNPDDRIIYQLRPNLDVIFTGVPVRTNSYGMRGPETTIEKPAGTFRIALLGDSYAFGWGVDEGKSFARLIEQNLNAMTKGSPRVELLNFAVPGYSTFNEVTAFQMRGAAFQPDAVLVFFVENDFELPFLIRDLSGSGELVKSFSLFRFGSKLFYPRRSKEIVNERGWNPNKMLAELEDFTGRNNMQLFLALNPQGDVKGVLEKLKILKKKRSMQLININDDFHRLVAEKGYTARDLYLPKDPHPSVLGHRLYADLLTPALAGCIRKSETGN